MERSIHAKITNYMSEFKRRLRGYTMLAYFYLIDGALMRLEEKYKKGLKDQGVYKPFKALDVALVKRADGVYIELLDVVRKLENNSGIGFRWLGSYVFSLIKYIPYMEEVFKHLEDIVFKLPDRGRCMLIAKAVNEGDVGLIKFMLWHYTEDMGFRFAGCVKVIVKEDSWMVVRDDEC